MKICKTEGCERAIKDNKTFCDEHPYNYPDGCWMMIGFSAWSVFICVLALIFSLTYKLVTWCFS